MNELDAVIGSNDLHVMSRISLIRIDDVSLVIIQGEALAHNKSIGLYSSYLNTALITATIVLIKQVL